MYNRLIPNREILNFVGDYFPNWKKGYTFTK